MVGALTRDINKIRLLRRQPEAVNQTDLLTYTFFQQAVLANSSAQPPRRNVESRTNFFSGQGENASDVRNKVSPQRVNPSARRPLYGKELKRKSTRGKQPGRRGKGKGARLRSAKPRRRAQCQSTIATAAAAGLRTLAYAYRYTNRPEGGCQDGLKGTSPCNDSSWWFSSFFPTRRVDVARTAH